MKIVILIKSVPDTKIPLEWTEESGRLKEDWNACVLNPDDALAVAEALKIKKRDAGTHITVVHLGPQSGCRFIRDALALGCDEGVRIWDEGLDDIHTAGKRLIFARAAAIVGFDLLITGTKSADTGSAQLGILLASTLNLPCITRVESIDAVGPETITATRRLPRGYKEQVESARPLVIAVEADEEPVLYASFPDLSRAAETDIPCFDLSDIGVPRQAIQRAESRLAFGPLRLPAPRVQFVQPPDSSLPAFERRRQLQEGFHATRQGKVVRGSADDAAEELFQTLLKQGWLGHLRGKSEKA